MTVIHPARGCIQSLTPHLRYHQIQAKKPANFMPLQTFKMLFPYIWLDYLKHPQLSSLGTDELTCIRGLTVIEHCHKAVPHVEVLRGWHWCPQNPIVTCCSILDRFDRGIIYKKNHWKGNLIPLLVMLLNHSLITTTRWQQSRLLLRQGKQQNQWVHQVKTWSIQNKLVQFKAGN